MPDTPELPLVSVVTPMYNAENFIEETIKSVSDSTYGRVEYLLVNDGSNDDSLGRAISALKSFRFPSRIVSQSNAGEPKAVNAGVSLASGKYLLVLNADDKIHPQLLERAVQILESNTEIVVAYPDWEIIDSKGASLRLIETYEYSVDLLLGDAYCIPGPGALIRREALGDQSLREPGLNLVSDFASWLTLSLKGDFIRIPEVLAQWRSHDGATTNQRRGGSEISRQIITAVTSHLKREELPSSHRVLRRQARSMALYRAALQGIYQGDSPGRRYMLGSLLIVFRRRTTASKSSRSLWHILAILAGPSCINQYQRIKKILANVRQTSR